MAFDAKVQVSQLVIGQRVCSELHYYSSRSILLHHSIHNLHKQLVEGVIVDAYFQGDIQRIIFAWSFPNRIAASSPREKVVSILMERYCHHSVGEKEGLFYSITMMDINIEIKYSWMELQQFQNTQNDVVGIAEPTSLTLFGVMEPSTPINRYISIPSQKYMRSIDRSPTGKLAEFVESSKSWTVSTFTHMKLVFLFAIGDDLFPLAVILQQHIVGIAESLAPKDVPTDVVLQVAYVLRMVESQQLLPGGMPRFVYVQVSIEIEALDERLSHRDSFRFHGVVFGVVKFCDLLVVEIGHLSLSRHLNYKNTNYNIGSTMDYAGYIWRSAKLSQQPSLGVNILCQLATVRALLPLLQPLLQAARMEVMIAVEF